MNQARSGYINSTVSARFWQLGELNEDTQHIWFVLHGQGQLSEYYIRKFKSLLTPNTAIIAPEALHKYYLDGFSGKVGASWMTKEDRLVDIANYITYLDNLFANLAKQVDLDTVKINLLGFSQGSATVSRWAVNGNVKFDHLIIWAGHFPPDLDTKNLNLLRSKRITIVYGTEDPFLTTAGIQRINADIERLAIEPSIIKFNGGHEINEAALSALTD